MKIFLSKRFNSKYTLKNESHIYQNRSEGRVWGRALVLTVLVPLPKLEDHPKSRKSLGLLAPLAIVESEKCLDSEPLL